MKRSAGILPYKIEDGNIKVYLEHPGGPYWEGIDKWSICKGEYKSESAIQAAKREFLEETGYEIKEEDLTYLGGYKQKSNKLVNIFIVNQDIDVTKMKSNTFKLEWPVGSLQIMEFPEMDEARWFDIETAKIKIFDGQIYFLRKLEKYVTEKIKK